MQGISLELLKYLENLIGNQFDSIAVGLLGLKPSFEDDKRIVFNLAPGKNLTSLFMDSLGKQPSKQDAEILRTMLSVANGYVDALKERTSARIVNDVDSYIKTQTMQNKAVSGEKIDEIFHTTMDKAKKHFKMIAVTESNKCINTGTALQIAQIAKDTDQDDPTVFFIVTVDDVTGPEEFILHLLPDRKTPRLWKLSELGAGYHKVGEPNAKIQGLHPHCRCRLTYLSPGFAFNSSGNVMFKSLGHDEFASQREKYGKPR